MSEIKRRKIMVDYGRWQAVLKQTRKSSQPSTVAVLVAMENSCFEQRSKHGGNAFVGSYPFLASMSGVHEDTVRNAVELLEQIDVIRVKRNYDVRRKRYFENYYTLLLLGGGWGGGMAQGGVMEREGTPKSVALSKEKGEASKCPPLSLRHFDASSKKDIEEAVAAKKAAAAAHKVKKAAEAAKRKVQEEAAHAERMRLEAVQAEELRERWRIATEAAKAKEEAAKVAEDARRLAMRTDVGSCVAGIQEAWFDEYDYGTLFCSKYNYDRATYEAAVKWLPAALGEKLKALMKNCPWDFE